MVTITNTMTVTAMTTNAIEREGLQMKKIKWMMGLLGCLFLGAVAVVQPSSAADDPAMVVGRIFHIEGDLLRYVPAENDWVAVVRDAPFGTEDTLFSGSRGMAEPSVPLRETKPPAIPSSILFLSFSFVTPLSKVSLVIVVTVKVFVVLDSSSSGDSFLRLTRFGLLFLNTGQNLFRLLASL